MRDNDKPSRETSTILMILCVCIAVILMLLMSGCKTTHEVERVYTHDTLHVHHSDTIKEVKVTHHTDTVRQVEKHTYTINNVGDTIREIHHYHDVQHTIVVDSTDRYKAKTDSLQSIIDKMREEITIVKKPSLWARLKDYAIGGVITLIVQAVVWWRRKK